MEEEQIPLLISEPVKTPDYDDTDRESTSSDSLVYRLGLVASRDYGTDFNTVGKHIPEEERMKYSWNNINAYGSSKEVTSGFCGLGGFSETAVVDKQILNNIDGLAYPCEILAIMGASGSGKTTLLNALTHMPTEDIAITGLRMINGIPIDGKQLRSVSAYVQQDDLFIPTLTVKEHLIFQALVRMESKLSYNQRLTRVEEVLSELLLKKCENTIIGYTDQGGISGGEKKRLSFAAEILTNPHILFCDEPTSGLDSFMALQVVQALKAMTDSGRTVICTVHQPSSELYKMFDKIMLLSEGTLAFLGDRQEAEMFFQSLDAKCPRNYNPADYFIKLLSVIPEKEESCRHAIEMICTRFHNSSIGVKVSLDSAHITPEQERPRHNLFNGENTSLYKNSCWAQFRAVLWRSWISMMKDPLVVKVRFIQTVITSLLIGLIYYGQELNQEGVMNINGVLFIFLTNMTFQNVFAVINVFTIELPVFLREHRNGMYRTDVYFLSKTLAELPFFILLPIVFTSVCYYLIGLNGNVAKFFITCGIVILVANVALSYGYFVSCIATNTTMALTLGAPLIIPFLLFGGYFMNVNSIPLYFKWLSYLSWFKYGNEALMINQWEDVTNIDCASNTTVCPKNGHIILEAYNFSEGHFALDIAVLFCLIIGFRFLAFLALLKKTYKC